MGTYKINQVKFILRTYRDMGANDSNLLAIAVSLMEDESKIVREMKWIREASA